METAVIKVGGMSCQGCVKSVTGILTAQAGVSRAQVSLEAAQAEVEFDPGTTSVSALKAVIEEAGFDAS